MDIFDALRQDHRQLEKLFQQALADKQKAESFDLFRRLFAAHTDAEQRFFYLEVEAAGLKKIILVYVEEHNLADLLLDELMDMNGQEENWIAKLTLLTDLIRMHITKEEKELFPLVERTLSSDKKKEILNNYLMVQ